MKNPKFFLFFLCIVFVFSSVSAISLGVIEPRKTCIKPDREWIIPVSCNNGDKVFREFSVSIDNSSFMSVENNSYLFLPQSTQKIPIFLDTTGVEQGFYIGNFIFCPSSGSSNGGSGSPVTFCIETPIHVNVSEKCEELVVETPEKVPVPVEEQLFLGLIKFGTLKTIMSYFALILVILVLLYFIKNHLGKKKNKK